MGIIIVSLILTIAILCAFVVGILRSSLTDLGDGAAAELLFGKPIQIYKDVFLLVDEKRSPHTSVAYDFSLYEERNIVGMTYWGPDADEEGEVGMVPKITLNRYKDGTVLAEV